MHWLYNQLDYDEILKLVEDLRQEENLYIDFKQKAHSDNPGIADSDRSNLAKALSGFSNSSGGILIWGVDARKLSTTTEVFPADVAQGLVPITGVTAFLSNITTLVGTALNPPNTGVECKKIVIPGETDKGFVVVYVPQSDLPPHMAILQGLNRYYLRQGDGFYPAEHYMIDYMFGTRRRPKLEIDYKITSGARLDGKVECQIFVGIKNVGRYVARFPAFRIRESGYNIGFHSPMSGSSEKWEIDRISKLIGFSYLNPGYIWTGGNDDVIHPGTSMDIAKIRRLLSYQTIEKEKGFSFDYEIYADGCEPVIDRVSIDALEIVDKLGL